MNRTLLFVALATFVAGTASAGLFDEEHCSHTAMRAINLPLSGVTRVVIDSGAGWLKVDGEEGTAQLRARGEACASDDKTLQQIQLVARKEGSELHLEARMPENVVFFGFFDASMNLSVALPPNMPVSIDDGSGSVTLRNIGPLKIDDGSGELIVRNVHGSAEVEDGSGSIDIDGVSGDVKLDDGSGSVSVTNVGGSVTVGSDGSGSLTIRNVQGSVLIADDGSGSLQIEDVKRDVRIREKGSGSVLVTGVGGNFTVEDKGSGGISYARVAGKVSVPKD